MDKRKEKIWANAQWIWGEEKYPSNEYVDFLLEFEIEEVDQDAKMYLSVDSEYALWINDCFVSCGIFDTYPERKCYDSLEVGIYLKQGKNELRITGYYQGVSTMQYAAGERGLCFCIHNHAQRIVSDEQVLTRLSTTYQSGEMEMITSQLGFTFAYDARGENSGEAWKKARVLHPALEVEKRPVEKLMVRDTGSVKVVAQGYFLRSKNQGQTVAEQMYRNYLSHRRFEEIFEGSKSLPLKIQDENPDGGQDGNQDIDKDENRDRDQDGNKDGNGQGVYLILDLQRETSGYLSMQLSASEGTRIELAYGEHLCDMRVRSKIGSRNFAASYICKEGQQSFQSWFKRLGARYLQLHISDYRYFELQECGIKAAEYPVRPVIDFSEENQHRQRIFTTCIETLKLCMHEHYEDCPWREQGLYAFDSRNQALYGYYAFGEYTFARASLDLLGQRVDENGQINICAPTDNELRIPSFTLWWFVEMQEYAKYSKDRSLLRVYWEQIKGMADILMDSGQNGIVRPPVGDNYWQFYEWSNLYEGYTAEMKELYQRGDFVDGVYMLIASIALERIAWMAQRMEDRDYCDKVNRKRLEIQEYYTSHFWNEEEGLYASYRRGETLIHYGEFVQALALYVGMGSSKQQEVLYRKLFFDEIKQKVTLSSAVFKYEAMVQLHPEEAEAIYQKIEDLWSTMLYRQATSFWETIEGEEAFDLAGSLCHGWSSLPIYFYYRYVREEGKKDYAE